MEPCILPCSPNWFLCSVSSGSESGLYAFGSKTDVLVYDVSLTLGRVSSTSGLGKSSESVAPPAFVGCYSGHRDKVTAVRLHPDSLQWTCCSSDDYSVNLWDIRSLVSMQVHNEHKEKITSMTWSASNLDLILTSDEKGTVVMWRIKSNSVQSFRLEREYIYSLEMSPHSSSRLAIGYRSGVALIVGLDRDNPQILQRLRGHEGEILSMRWCPAEGVCTLRGDEVDMESLIATADKRCIKVWSTSNGKELMYRKISQNSSYRHDPQEPGGRRAWLSLHWPKYQPFELVFSSQSGDLLLWDLKGKPSQEPDRLIARDMAQHTRLIFNIASLSSDGDKVVSFSLDRTVVIWDIKARKGVCSFSSFGGYVYCARASPLEPGCVAIGAGDNMIRVWNQGKRTNPFDISTHYYGMKSKITTVSWHPQREGLLAYGTEDGRVGVYNLLSSKYPSMSGTFHNKIVYVVCWAPPLEAGKGGHDFEVYSVGDGIILQHYIGDGETKRDAVNLVKAIQAVNGEEKEKINRSEISWHSDFTMFAVGCDNGSVTVYSFPRLQRICSVSLHQKLVNCIRWHPQTTGESPHLSPCHSLVAFAGNDSCVTVVDLSQVFLGTASGSSSPLREVQAYRQLQGHHQRTTDLCWSPHHDGRMVTVGYDNVAVVWDVRTSAVLACYNQHPGRLLTVLWSNLDPDLIMTGGFDSTFRMWKVSEQPKEVTSADRKKKKKKAPPKVPEAVSEDKSISSAAELASEQEMEELMDLLKQKRQLLMSELHLDKDKDVTNNASESRGSVPAPNAVATTAAPRSGDITPGAASVTAA
ncbi:gem-associated protein 5, partial [Aplysia californica]|uniref:Gem-associated protein 5 n=1 Tax=Aplysia californica TaxID=6500 RepID=A0ABM1ADM0_APLCA